MRTRRTIFGLITAALIFGGSALPAQAILGLNTPPVPTPEGLQTLVQSFVPATPSVTPPEVDPANPTLPLLPFVAVPPGLAPALGVLSPTTVVTCQVSYLGPLAAIVALTIVLDTAGVDPPVRPSFLDPLFSPVVTACAVAPYPSVSSCGPDGTVTEQVAGLPAPPGAGPLPAVDPFASVPAPFASVVVAVAALDNAVSHYAYGGAPAPNLSQKVANQLTCS